jgi:hypothetical protein
LPLLVMMKMAVGSVSTYDSYISLTVLEGDEKEDTIPVLIGL